MKDISCWTAAGAAFRRTKTILFQPFRFSVWALLGLCAWLCEFGVDIQLHVNRFSDSWFKKHCSTSRDAWENAFREFASGNRNAVRQVIDTDYFLSINPWMVAGVIVFVAAMVVFG